MSWMLHNAHKVTICIGNENSNLPPIIIHTYHVSVPNWQLITRLSLVGSFLIRAIKHESERFMTQMECSLHAFLNFQACMEGFEYIDFAILS